MLSIGDYVKHKNFKWLKSNGTIVDKKDPIHIPFATIDNIYTDAQYKVKWDNKKYGVSDWLNESELVIV